MAAEFVSFSFIRALASRRLISARQPQPYPTHSTQAMAILLILGARRHLVSTRFNVSVPRFWDWLDRSNNSRGGRFYHHLIHIVQAGLAA